ncbi:MAG: methyltransferase domain-containing protein [Thermomicrobiales bacterium]
MADIWSTVATLDPASQEVLAAVLETRAAHPRQQEMRREFLSSVTFPASARVLEVGCGTGALTRTIAGWSDVGSVVGLDPAPSLLAKARELSTEYTNIFYREGDGRALPFDDATFDVVVFDSTLCHIPGPEVALAEAARILRAEGLLAIFDGDYVTSTVALSEHDPLQTCVSVLMSNVVNDRYIVRRMPTLVREAGFEVITAGSHGLVETSDQGYVMTIIDRGADMLCASGVIGEALAAALKAEARSRADSGCFFGHVSYGSLVARKPKMA